MAGAKDARRAPPSAHKGGGDKKRPAAAAGRDGPPAKKRFVKDGGEKPQFERKPAPAPVPATR